MSESFWKASAAARKKFIADTKAQQSAYAMSRKLYREQWAQSDAEDFCARKEVEPGTYKWLSDE